MQGYVLRAGAMRVSAGALIAKMYLVVILATSLRVPHSSFHRQIKPVSARRVQVSTFANFARSIELNGVTRLKY